MAEETSSDDPWVDEDGIGEIDNDGDVFLRNQTRGDGSVQLMMAGYDAETGVLVLHELDKGAVAAPMGGTWEKITLVDPVDFPALRTALDAPEGVDLIDHLAANFVSGRSWEITRRIDDAGILVKVERF
jgi:hypothetical protein